MRARWAMLALLVVLAPSRAAAHGFDPGVLALIEESPGRYRVLWTEPVDTRRARPVDVRIDYPSACRRELDRLACSGGLAGAIRFSGLPTPRTRVIVSIRRLDGTSQEGVVTGDAPTFSIEARPGSSLPAWVGLGVEHVLSGIDHVAFVIGLLLVVAIGARADRPVRRTLFAITAFTVAHSITLALAALELVELASAPVEASIAASVVLVAREGLDPRPTLTRRAPWLVAFAFGLVHGLGFAGALRELGLPSTSMGVALAGFNLGVELGQIAIVALVAIVALAARRWLKERSARLHAATCYAIGGLGAWWLVERTIAILA